MRLFILAILAVLFWPLTARAFQEEMMTHETMSASFIIPFIPDFVTVPEGGLAWEVLAETREVEFEGETEQGYPLFGLRPEFPEKVQALDGEKVVMQGYMFPLEQSEKQSRFLFGPFPASCPYHYHVGPSMVIEVHAQRPLDFSFDAVNLEGRLELVEMDVDFNIFYRMHEARLVR